MPIYVGGDRIKQIYVGADTTIRKVYYGRSLVWEIEATLESNIPVTKTIYLTPGQYEIYVVGGGGGSAASGGGGGNIGTENVNAEGGT